MPNVPELLEIAFAKATLNDGYNGHIYEAYFSLYANTLYAVVPFSGAFRFANETFTTKTKAFTLIQSRSLTASRIVPKPYVGINVINGQYELFRFPLIPTMELQGPKYIAVIGPFKTTKGAQFMADYGKGNPHCQHVNDAEKLANL